MLIISSTQKIEWITKGIYSYLHNPIYDGFVLMLVGLALVTQLSFNLILAFASFMLLNVFLASVENSQFKLTELV